MELGTPLGLGLASGVNAYLPLLSFAIATRWLHVYHINSNVAFVTSDWFIIALVILTLVDFIADKIPVFDHFWDVTHTFVRPLAGALVAVISSNQVTLPVHISALSSSVLGVADANVHLAGAGLGVMALIGGILALMSHASKSTVRIASTFATAGLLNAFLSLGEDMLVIVAILLSLFVPALMLILVILFLLILGPTVFRLLRHRLRRPGPL